MTRHLKTRSGVDLHCDAAFHRSAATFRVDECDCAQCLVLAYDDTRNHLVRIADRIMELAALAEEGGDHAEA